MRASASAAGRLERARGRFLALSTPEVSDALDALGAGGALHGLRPAEPGQKLFGPAFTVAREPCPAAGRGRAADYLDEVPPGYVVAIDNRGITTSTCWGGILTRCARHLGIAGTVIDGAFRDCDVVRETGYPVFARGVCMTTGKGRTQLCAVGVPLELGAVRVAPGDLLFGDDHGVVVVPATCVEEVAARAEAVRATEAEIAELVVDRGTPLRVARERLGYHELTRSVSAGRTPPRGGT